MHFYDMTNDGKKELIVGRDDGLVEVYAVNEQESIELLQHYVREVSKFNIIN